MTQVISLTSRSFTRILIMCAMVSSLLAAGIAQAETLTSTRIQSFLDTRDDLAGFDDDYPGLQQASEEIRDMTSPLSSAIPALEQFPEARKHLEKTVTEHGFDSVEDWANVGDRIILAQIAISMQDMSAEERAMSEEMMSADYGEDMPEYMKERAREMAAGARAMRSAAEAVPPEDIEAVRPFMNQLDPEEYK
ncbi:hypothetical protein [Marinobacter zhanjiangensis]|uniref:Cytochrome c556 n=1 Tax=Marinobacter zhanjiangensis TaxID=578215 RepID=A0ABQ3AMM6_9GAMM|nr:hypothetical protein [Marinobacter zhanjiangensis]GGY61348.1 hypothetical protein GCM10007071_05210 [Marinobacter zhanjiangensis]